MAGEIQSCINWDDVVCPICLNSPHNCVLLNCSSYEKGCRPFVCDTNHLHSNCLDRYKEANGMPAGAKSSDSKPVCPLCRGEVTGWTVLEEPRLHLDVKVQFCSEENCPFTGNYSELQNHAKNEHPDSCPSRIDPVRRVQWENLQRSSELIDVLTHIHSEVPNGIILGDYVVDYDEENSGDEGEGGDDGGHWWGSCIFYQIFGSFTTCRSRRRSRDTNGGDGDGEVTGPRELSRERSGQRSSRRHPSRSNEN